MGLPGLNPYLARINVSCLRTTTQRRREANNEPATPRSRVNHSTTEPLSSLFLAFKPSDIVFIMLINVKMPTLVDILTSMSIINFVLSRVEHEKKFYNLKIRVHNKIFSYFSTKTYVVGTQKNWLIETVLVSTQNTF